MSDRLFNPETISAAIVETTPILSQTFTKLPSIEYLGVAWPDIRWYAATEYVTSTSLGICREPDQLNEWSVQILKSIMPLGYYFISYDTEGMKDSPISSLILRGFAYVSIKGYEWVDALWAFCRSIYIEFLPTSFRQSVILNTGSPWEGFEVEAKTHRFDMQAPLIYNY